MWYIRFAQILFCSIFINSFYSTSAFSQTIPDNTLGEESSTVTRTTINNNIADSIEGGAIRSGNLFHSFSEFNVDNGNAVYFANPDGIANILTRVTGNNLSNIFGILGVDGAANLWLLNPNGIVFGENATLDLNGSFFATTADSYVFENEFAYSASNPQAPPILTVNIPTGIQFGSKAESIVNRSQTPNEDDFPSGLQLDPGNNMTLIGGNILFESGHITVPSGQIELSSVASNSFIALKPSNQQSTLDYGDITAWQNIQLAQQSTIDTSGDGAGEIEIRGQQITLQSESAIYADNLGEKNSGTVSIFGSELVELIGGQNDGESVSIIQSVAFDNGKGGSLVVETDSLRLIDGGQIGPGTSGAGDSGDLSVVANEIYISGISPDGLSSGLFTSVGDFVEDPSLATGMGGNLNIETNNLSLADEGIIEAGTFGFGNSGDININARQQVLVDGATIDSSTFEQGDSGNITIDTQQLRVIGEASQIGTANFGSGKAGNLIVKASDSVEIQGFGVFPDFEQEDQLDIFSSGLFTSVETGATGNGGNLSIETNKLTVSQGGKIVANTLGTGDAGDITIRANIVEVKDAVTDFFGGRSGINSNVEIIGTGDGGDLNIYADRLEISKGGSIAVDAKGQGNAGNIYLEAGEISLGGTSTVRVIADIEQPALASQISAFAQGDFDAGSITINTDSLDVVDQGEISVNNIGQGNSGNLNITAQNLSIANSGKLTAEVNGGEEGNINLTTDNLFLSNFGSISAQAQGTSTGGNITINNTDNLVIAKNSTVVANATQGNGGEIEIATQGYFVSGNSLVSASSEFGLDGNVEIETINGDRPLELEQLPEKVIDPATRIAQACGAGNDRFAIAGRGGLPENPSQNLRGQSIWQDLRLPVMRGNITPSPSRNSRSNAMLVEADSWQITQQGKVQLLVHHPKGANLQRNYQPCSELEKISELSNHQIIDNKITASRQ